MDGCSAPTFGMTVETGAVGYARLANPELVSHFSENRKNAIKIMTKAITTYPCAGITHSLTLSYAPNYSIIPKFGG